MQSFVVRIFACYIGVRADKAELYLIPWRKSSSIFLARFPPASLLDRSVVDYVWIVLCDRLGWGVFGVYLGAMFVVLRAEFARLSTSSPHDKVVLHYVAAVHGVAAGISIAWCLFLPVLEAAKQHAR